MLFLYFEGILGAWKNSKKHFGEIWHWSLETTGLEIWVYQFIISEDSTPLLDLQDIWSSSQFLHYLRISKGSLQVDSLELITLELG
jgi:hypothetical protein